jgi:hypothetical protein
LEYEPLLLVNLTAKRVLVFKVRSDDASVIADPPLTVTLAIDEPVIVAES